MMQDNTASANEPIVRTETIEPGIALVTMNRPERLNAMNAALVAELRRVFDELDRDPEVRVVVLTGAGRGFCAGIDLKAGNEAAQRRPAVQADSVAQMFEVQEDIASLHERIHRLRKPVIAAVNGPAVGGGFTLALASDIRVASHEARFGAVFITLGLSACDMGCSYFLPRLVGLSRATELMLTGRIFDAAEAKELSLVVDVVPGEQLIERALCTARLIAKHSPLGVWMTKETLGQSVDAPSLRAALDMENRTQVLCGASGSFEQAAAAFRGKAPR